MTIENGVVCYGSTNPGLTAQYVCDSGYQLDGDSERRECQTDGQWSLPVPECVEKGKTLLLYAQHGLIHVIHHWRGCFDIVYR